MSALLSTLCLSGRLVHRWRVADPFSPCSTRLPASHATGPLPRSLPTAAHPSQRAAQRSSARPFGRLRETTRRIGPAALFALNIFVAQQSMILPAQRTVANITIRQAIARFTAQARYTTGMQLSTLQPVGCCSANRAAPVVAKGVLSTKCVRQVAALAAASPLISHARPSTFAGIPVSTVLKQNHVGLGSLPRSSGVFRRGFHVTAPRAAASSSGGRVRHAVLRDAN